MRKKNVLLSVTNSEFVKADFELLSSFSDTKQIYFKNSNKGFFLFLNQLRVLLFILKNGRSIKSFHIWFADYHCFFPTILKKVFKYKILLCLGGYDSVRIEEFDYGILGKGIRWRIAKYCIRKSDKVLFSSKFQMELFFSQNKNFELNDVSFVYPVFSKIDVESIDYSIKENAFVCVSFCSDYKRFYIKGIDRYLELAQLLPQFKFHIVGLNDEFVKKNNIKIPNNVVTYKNLSRNELFKLFSLCKFSAQLSRYESYGLAIQESLFFNCTPIVTNETGLVENVQSCLNKLILNQDFLIYKMSQIVDEFVMNMQKKKINQNLNTFFLKNEEIRLNVFKEFLRQS